MPAVAAARESRRGTAGPVRCGIRTRADADTPDGSTLYGRVHFTVNRQAAGIAHCKTPEEFDRALEFAGIWLEKCHPRSAADAWGERLVPAMPLPAAAAIARCEAEQAEIQQREDVRLGVAPAYLVAMGMADWEAEKHLIRAEMDERRSSCEPASPRPAPSPPS